MTQTEDGKELVLGNKQLISLFFVVAALLGVAFAVGYNVGRNSNSPMPAAAGGEATSSSPIPRQDSEGARDSAAAQPSPDPLPKETEPSQQVRQQPEARVEKPRPSTTAPVADAAVAKQVAGATYLQVTALRRPEADNLVSSLKEQSFPAALVESSRPGLYRVLVGPYHETARVAEAKARLKGLGFANAFVQH